MRDVVDTLVVDISFAYFALQTTTDGSWKVEREGERQKERQGREGEGGKERVAAR